ncbi:hypothetical protein F5144DRAFT_492409 [Chaetomium tenue]|uniref:Uncharacterized protein n=1 Tax=Chaetomium tenue TaxID=1854479 RepID=A0ACB7P7J4_9PEZI|nr:hypothetical protein F5144DRAFT_492409 [Chaetomium globosum]
MSWQAPGKKLTWADWPVPGNGVEIKNSPTDEGTNDILRVTKELENHGIPCCLVGISALIFYGAHRDWEICVPTELVDDAAKLLGSNQYAEDWHPTEPWPHYDTSLVWSYHRFKGKRLNYYFVLVPSRDVHLVCDPANFTRSVRGLPYPKLDVFIQSTLDMYDDLQLVDVVDGTDVSEEWGEEHLDLDGDTDSKWAEDLNKRGAQLAGGRFGAITCFANDMPVSKRRLWQEAVRTKERRLDWTKPKEVYVTQYRFRDAPEPWTVLSDGY